MSETTEDETRPALEWHYCPTCHHATKHATLSETTVRCAVCGVAHEVES